MYVWMNIYYVYVNEYIDECVNKNVVACADFYIVVEWISIMLCVRLFDLTTVYELSDYGL